MLLSVADKARFKILYLECTHSDLAKIFNVSKGKVIETAKGMGIYVPYNNTKYHGRVDNRSEKEEIREIEE